MAIIGLNEAAATQGALSSPLGSATPGGMSQLLEILKLVNDIVHSPLASSMAARFTGVQGQGGNSFPTSPVIDVAPVQQPAQLPAQAAAPAPAPEPVLDEKKFIEMLMTPQGREMMNRGLQQIKDLGGDLTISQMQDLLRSGKPLEQKTPEQK